MNWPPKILPANILLKNCSIELDKKIKDIEDYKVRITLIQKSYGNNLKDKWKIDDLNLYNTLCSEVTRIILSYNHRVTDYNTEIKDLNEEKSIPKHYKYIELEME